jgi:HPt (histidine-containing phosphotransfer) domain-containing protein
LASATASVGVPHLPGFGPFQVKVPGNKKQWEAGMAQVAVGILEQEGAALKGSVLDRAHLERMTLGDRSLEREVLQLFDRQAELLIGRMRGSAPAAVATLAHTLKGSATGIGAGRVARAAEDTELSANQAPEECGRAIDRLALAIGEVRVEIDAILRTQ